MNLLQGRSAYKNRYNQLNSYNNVHIFQLTDGAVGTTPISHALIFIDGNTNIDQVEGVGVGAEFEQVQYRTVVSHALFLLKNIFPNCLRDKNAHHPTLSSGIEQSNLLVTVVEISSCHVVGGSSCVR